MRVRHLVASAIVAVILVGSAHAQSAGTSPVIEAVKQGNAATLRALIAKKADVRAAERDGTTALHWAVRADDSTLVDLLLRAGADANATNRYGVSPLPLAATNGNALMVGALLKAGAKPDSAMGNGQTALEADILALLRSLNRSGDATLIVPSTYLEAVIRKA